MKIIAHVHNAFPTKFGLPRQSGLAPSLESFIVFEKEYRVPEAFRGLEGYSHIWVLWKFHEAAQEGWSPTVRPPRLGGNARMGVFATRSPFRPNPIGLSVLKLEEILFTRDGPVLRVSGADMMDGTPVYDIKPYLPHIDSHPEALGGFALEHAAEGLTVHLPDSCRALLTENECRTLTEVLAQDPRPHYQHDSTRVYGFAFGPWEVKFTVDGSVLTVCGLEKTE